MAKDYQSAKEGLVSEPREILIAINNALVAASNADFPPTTTKEIKGTLAWRTKLRQYGRELAAPAVESVDEKLIRSQDLVFLLLDRAMLIQARSMALEKMPFGLFDLSDPPIVEVN